MEILAAIISIIKAIPTIDKWAERFFVAYRSYQKGKILKENAEAIRKAIDEHDQRKLEEAIGHPNPGSPSGDAGAIVREPRYGVHQPPGNKS